MRRVPAMLALVAAIAACGQPHITASAPASSGTHEASGARVQAPSYGVMVDLLSDPATYTISVVSWDGTVAAKIKAARRALQPNSHGHPLELPYVSATQGRLYYLDGDHDVRELVLNGFVAVQQTVTQLDVGPDSEAVFAVSPDDAQIAVSVIDFSRSPAHVLLYTQPMPFGNRHVLFESDTDYVWPVAWHNGQLVLAHAFGAYVEDALKAAPGQDNPYWAVSYHVVDPSTAVRDKIIGEACTVSGPLSPAGSACIQGGTVDWAGANTVWSTHDWGSISSAASLSPDGAYVAAAQPDDQTKLAFYRPGGSILYYVAGPGAREWAGWLDSTHLIVGSANDVTFQTRVVTLTSAGPALTYPNVHGFYAARLPTDIS